MAPPRHCPVCKTEFSSATNVLQHLNQPRGSCKLWHTEVLEARRSIEANSELREALGNMFTHLEHPVSPHGPFAGYADPSGPESQGPPAEPSPFPRFEEFHPNRPEALGLGKTIVDHFFDDAHMGLRITSRNLYYPFRDWKEWEFVKWLVQTHVTQKSLDKYLNLQLTKEKELSFRTAEEFRSRLEHLPAGPEWRSQEFVIPGYETSEPMVLYYREPLEVIAMIFSNPVFRDLIPIWPSRLYRDAEFTRRFHKEWIHSDHAWALQALIPKGSTMLGILTSADKTQVTGLSGDQSSYPALIGIMNMLTSTRGKPNAGGLLLTALLPIGKFIGVHKDMVGSLHSIVHHVAMDYLFHNTKEAARDGAMLVDPWGVERHCFTPLIAHVVDTPEGILVAAVGGSSSATTVAANDELGSATKPPIRHGVDTLDRYDELVSQFDNSKSLISWILLCKQHHLNGVVDPYWRDWQDLSCKGGISDPAFFLNVEPLHDWSKFFWDHVWKWAVHFVGVKEIAFRVSLLHIRIRKRHYKGITKLKQVTGRVHRQVMSFIMVVIAGAVPREVLLCIRNIVDLFYDGWAPEIDEGNLASIGLDHYGLASMARNHAEFHRFKPAIAAGGARKGKGGKQLGWRVPKIAKSHLIVDGVRYNGVPIQFSAEGTEQMHGIVIKKPMKQESNGRDVPPQILRSLDRRERVKHFDLVVSIIEASDCDLFDLPSDEDEDEVDPDEDYSENEQNGEEEEEVLEAQVHDSVSPAVNTGAEDEDTVPFRGVPRPPTSERPTRNLFKDALVKNQARIFATTSTGFILNHRHNGTHLVDAAADLYLIPDLRAALADWLAGHPLDGRCFARPDALLPFTKVRVWHKLRVQTKETHPPHDVSPVCHIKAEPPGGTRWIHGRCDTVLLKDNDRTTWPCLGLKDHTVAQVRILLEPVWSRTTPNPRPKERFLAYVQRFSKPEENFDAGLYGLKRVMRKAGTKYSRAGGIVPLRSIHRPIDVQPQFVTGRTTANWTAETVLEEARSFWVNKYDEKDDYWGMRHTVRRYTPD